MTILILSIFHVACGHSISNINQSLLATDLLTKYVLYDKIYTEHKRQAHNLDI